MPCFSQTLTRRLFLLAALLPGLPAQAETSSRETGELIAVTYLPHWLPQAQFAGFYLAKDMGFYEQAGLDVTILSGGPDRPASEWLAEGRADFSTFFLARGILTRAAGVPLVNIAQLLNRSSLLLVSHRDAGIGDAADLAGKKVGIWPEFRAQPLALFRQLGIEPEIVEQGATMGLFQWRGADAVSAMRYNEFQRLYLSGYDAAELRVIDLHAHGVGFPEDGIYTLEQTLEESPEMVAAFVEATMRGWQHAFVQPEDALDSIMWRIVEAGVPSNRAHQRLMLDALRGLYLNDEGSLRSTHLPEETFDRVARLLSEFGDLRNKPDYDSFHPTIGR